MSDSNCFTTSSLEGLISPTSVCVFIHYLRDLTLHIIFDTWWASINVGSRWPVEWNNSRHAPSWWFHLHCGIEETSSLDIRWIIGHQVLRHSSEHGTRSMGKHLFAKAHLAMLHKVTAWEVAKLTNSKGNETALAILTWQGSLGITIVSSQSQIIFDVWVIQYWLTWQTEHFKLAAMDFETS
jgi:hypothetical protein